MTTTHLFRPNQALTVTTDRFASTIAPGTLVHYIESDGGQYHECRLPDGLTFPFRADELNQNEAEHILPAYFEGVEILRSLPTGTVIEVLDALHAYHSLFSLRVRAANGDWFVPAVSGSFTRSTEILVAKGALVHRLPDETA